ncbi:hypothetical protein [Photobacterium satsumensis]|uniref:hypothetical protein n=1 Tax=Photobacterium satsumensis TaxID=2910239 RepID=UPI003D0B0540
MPKIVASKEKNKIITNSLILNTVASIAVALAIFVLPSIGLDILYDNHIWLEIRQFSLFFVFISVQVYLKRVLHSLAKLPEMYFTDIVYGASGTLLLLAFYDVPDVEYILLTVSMFVSVLFALFLLRKQFIMEGVFYIDRPLVIESSKLKLGAICYSVKDLIFPALLMALSPGYLTTYNFASKILNAILLIAVTPQNNLFVINCIEQVKSKSACLLSIRQYLFRTILKTSLTYAFLILSFLFLYELIQYFELKDFSNMNNFMYIAILLSIYYMVVVIEQPISRLVFALGKMTETMAINIVNFAVFLVLYFFKPEIIDMTYIFVLLVVPQVFNIILYTYFSKEVVFEKNRVCD